MTIQQLSKEEFRSHINTVSNCSFLQTPEMATLLQKRGMKTEFIGLKKDGKVMVAALLYSLPMTGGLHMALKEGPVATTTAHLPEFYADLATYAKQNGALELIIKPYQTYQTFDSTGQPTSEEQIDLIADLTKNGYQFDGLQTGYPGGEPDWYYGKQLTGLTPATLRASFSKKGKTLANKTASFGIQLRKLKRAELPIFKDITSTTSERRNYDDKPLSYYEDFYDAFGDDCEFMVASLNFQDYKDNLVKQQANLNATIDTIQQKLQNNPQSIKSQNQLREYQDQLNTFSVRLTEANRYLEIYGNKEVILAGSLFVYTHHEAVYLFSGSYPEFNKFYAPVALQEHVMQEAIRRGISFYNLFGIQGVFDGSDGVLRFKQNFNGSIVRKMGTFRYYPHPIKATVIAYLKRCYTFIRNR